MATVTCYLVRDTDRYSIPNPREPFCVGFRHDEEGHRYARGWATQNSAGRELAVVEIVDGKETGNEERFKDGKQHEFEADA